MVAIANNGTGHGRIRVTDLKMNAALDELLDTASPLTRSLLGGGPGLGELYDPEGRHSARG